MDRVVLALALFLSQFIGSAGITILFIAPSARTIAAGTLTNQALTVTSLVLLALFATSLSVICHRLGTPSRAVLGSALALWVASPAFGFEYAPSSVLSGNVLTGAIISIITGSAAFYLAFRDLLRVRVGIFRTLSRTTTGKYGSQRSFLDISPLRAMYRYHLTLFEFAGRVNLAGSSSYRTSRVRIQYVVLIASALALVYAILSLDIVPIIHSRFGAEAASREVVPSIAAILLTTFIPTMLSQSGLANERAWLAFTSMPPPKYIRHFLISRLLSALIILSPFVAVDAVLSLLGSQIALNSAVAITLFTPSSTVLTTYVSARVYPFQINEQGLQPTQFSLRQMLTVVPAFATVGFVGIALFMLLIGAIASLVLLALVLVVLRSDRLLQKLVFNLTEKGFI